LYAQRTHRVVSDRERERERRRRRKRNARCERARVCTRTESTHLVRAANATSCNLERSSMAEFNELNGALLLLSSSSSEEEEEEDALAIKPRERQTPLLLLLVVFFFFPREVMPPPAQRRRVWKQVDSIFVGEKSGAKVRRKKKKRDREREFCASCKEDNNNK
jgi:hypothetical protein